MSATPGSAAYYEQQMQAAKQREEQRAAQNQANQQVNYEAYQAATKEAQDKAVQTGQPQTVTQQDIQTQRQQILDTKYYNPAESSPEQKVYSVPLTGVNKEAQQAGYDYYYKPVPGFNKPQAQLAQENYIPNRQARQEAIAQNAVAGYNGGLMRPNVHYQVNLEDSISGPSKHYFVGLYEGKRPQYYGPPSPFESPRT